MERTMTVTELTAYIKQLVDNDRLLSNVWVSGEISNYKYHSSGHMYFSLKDKDAVIKCVMFRRQNSRLKFQPGEGMKVLAKGSISVYPQGGIYQLYVESMEPEGVGALYMAFEQLKNKLEKQGLFEPSRKKPLPPLPKAVGVITSPTGAVIRDIVHVLGRRYPNTRIIIYGSAVQGQEAPPQLIKGIQTFNRKKNVDVIILARGGGSLEDLWPFNNENLAYEIVKSQIPIVSAIGHETDFSISDFVADLRAATPSAAAEIVMPDKRAVKNALDSYKKRLEKSLFYNLKRQRDRINRLHSMRSLQRPLERVYHKRQQLDSMEKSIVIHINAINERRRASLKTAAGKLNALSPLTVLSRGYGVMHKEDGSFVRSAKSLNQGDKLIVTMTDGKFLAVYDKPVEG